MRVNHFFRGSGMKVRLLLEENMSKSHYQFRLNLGDFLEICVPIDSYQLKKLRLGDEVTGQLAIFNETTWSIRRTNAIFEKWITTLR